MGGVFASVGVFACVWVGVFACVWVCEWVGGCGCACVRPCMRVCSIVTYLSHHILTQSVITK